MYDITELASGQCRYPLTDDTPHKFCGDTIARGQYCAAHARLCYSPKKPKPWQALAGMIDATEENVRHGGVLEDTQPEIDGVFREAAAAIGAKPLMERL